MGSFRRALNAAQRHVDTASESTRRWVYIPYDQLSDRIGPLSELAPDEAGIVLVETPTKAARRPYHRQKLALVLSSMRHFAVEQAERGVAVDYRIGPQTVAEHLRAAAAAHGPLVCMRPAERELRAELAPLVRDDLLRFTAHGGWLSDEADFDILGAAPWRMDAFYRHLRQRTGLLMEDGKPEGGRYSHDGDNRQPFRGEPTPPTPPRFTPDAITEEVGALLTDGPLRDHPGTLDLGALPASAHNVQTHWRWVKEHCLTHFGPFEDAMSRNHPGLFHTRLSPLINLHRLLPADVVQAVAASDAPLNSREGFVRQVLGWREFVRHVHERTDGFRLLPGDEGFTGQRFELPPTGLDTAPDPRFLAAETPLPPAFWPDSPSGLSCLDTVVRDVWREGYSHHITRLMVLSNIARLLDVVPAELSDWFWVAYIDAYDWVVQPNVLGMGTFAAGELMTTKPYVSGANYLHKMSDYCGDCAFDPRRTCPLTSMYWAFLQRHRERLSDNPRLRLPLASCRKRSDEQHAHDTRIAERTRELLGEGKQVTPAALAGQTSLI